MTQNYEIVSQKIRERMEERKVSIRDLAFRLQLSYENTRCLIQGRRRLTERVVYLIGEYLEIKSEEIERLKMFDELLHRNSPGIPSMRPMERFWGALTEAHRQDLVCLARRWAGQDRRTNKRDKEAGRDKEADQKKQPTAANQ